jgi:hypothetical protein
MEKLRQELFEYIIAIASGEVVAFGVGFGTIKITLLDASFAGFGFALFKTFLLAFTGGVAGILGKYLISWVKGKFTK